MVTLQDSLEKAINSDCCQHRDQFRKICYEELLEKIFKISKKYFPYEAEDITQQIFLKIFEMDVKKFEPRLDYIQRYLLKIAHNHCKTLCKKKKQFVEISDLEVSLIKNTQPDFNLAIDLEVCLNQLPERQAFAIKKQIEGYKIEEISSMMNTSEGAVKNLIYYGKKVIKRRNISS